MVWAFILFFLMGWRKEEATIAVNCCCRMSWELGFLLGGGPTFLPGAPSIYNDGVATVYHVVACQVIVGR